MGGGSSCSAPRLRSKSDVAHVKADFWYLSVVSGAKRTPIKTSNNMCASGARHGFGITSTSSTCALILRTTFAFTFGGPASLSTVCASLLRIALALGSEGPASPSCIASIRATLAFGSRISIIALFCGRPRFLTIVASLASLAAFFYLFLCSLFLRLLEVLLCYYPCLP
jgi:hypothetical protein